VGSVIDEIAIVRSMWCHEVNHFPAVIEHKPAIVDGPLIIRPLAVGFRMHWQRQQEPADVRKSRTALFAEQLHLPVALGARSAFGR